MTLGSPHNVMYFPRHLLAAFKTHIKRGSSPVLISYSVLHSKSFLTNVQEKNNHIFMQGGTNILTSDVAGFVECLITRPTINFLMPAGQKYTKI